MINYHLSMVIRLKTPQNQSMGQIKAYEENSNSDYCSIVLNKPNDVECTDG